MTVYSPYYAEFRGETFVIQAESEAVEDGATMDAILRGIDDLLRHGIRAVLVFGKGTQFESELRAKFGAHDHPETNRLVIPESALARIRQERSRIARSIEEICLARSIPCCLIRESAIRVERRIGHGSTGVPTELDIQAVRTALDQSKLAIVGFGGIDGLAAGDGFGEGDGSGEGDCHEFLHVPSVSLAADLAVGIGARKLLFLMQSDGISVPRPSGGASRLSFADLEALLCLLQRQDHHGGFIISGAVLPKVHAAIRAVAGGVSQVHLVSYSRLLDEILTRTGVGTMIERRQSHHVDYARPEDLDEVQRLHVEAQRYQTPHGTPLVKPLDRAALSRLLPRTLLLRHRGVMIGKLHTTPVPGEDDTLQIGGVVIAENHQDSQQGQLLLSEALARLREQGFCRAVAISASQRAGRLFRRLGGIVTSGTVCESALLHEAAQRYAPEERAQLQLFEFRLDSPR